MSRLGQYIDAACDKKMAQDEIRRSNHRLYRYAHGLLLEMKVGTKRSTWPRFLWILFLFAILFVDHTIVWLIWFTKAVIKCPFAIASASEFHSSQENKGAESSQIPHSNSDGLPAADLLLVRLKIEKSDLTYPFSQKLAASLETRNRVVGMLNLADRLGLTSAIADAFLFDVLHRRIHYSAAPFSQFAADFVSAHEHLATLPTRDAGDALEAAGYSVAIMPHNIAGWASLAWLKQFGFVLPGDTRNHFEIGLKNAQAYLDNDPNIDPREKEGILFSMRHIRENMQLFDAVHH